ncbi:MAG: ammonium transporter [Candidatus Tectimicrobiota bacterium]|nr:MAG: ammonium transporter [Candidatus Tectomicrobia bacterium]
MRRRSLLTSSVLLVAWLSEAVAQEAQGVAALADTKVALDTLWTLLCAFLVMFMALGFAMLESGFCRAKNTVNILAKNLVVFAITAIAFLAVGWGLMFGDGTGFIGLKGVWFLSGPDNSPATGEAYRGVYGAIAWTGIPLAAKFLFQMVFAATAATIVSGAVAERIRFSAFLLFSTLMAGLLYPITGHWIWGGGWLQQRGMLDFAGSTVVHSVGGWAALAGALLLGPRLGKYTPEGRVQAIPGHSLTSATIGVFVLWFGWFGFNPGSTMAADWRLIGHIAATTNTAAAAATLSATATAWVLLGKPDFAMILNGAIAGLVAITAPCAFVSLGSAFFIGLGAGILVVLAVLFFDRIRVDDPVGAISVHLVCGAYGTLCVGLFAEPAVNPAVTTAGLFFGGGSTLFGVQLLGVVAVGAFTFLSSLVGWSLIKGLVGLRVPPEEELEGLDRGEHGNLAYPDFALVTTGREVTVPRPAPPVAAPVAATAQPAAAARGPQPSSRRPPLRPEAPRSPAGFQHRPFTLVVHGVDKRALKAVWEQLCYDYPAKTPKAFNELYPHVVTVGEQTFTFRQGDPLLYREAVERLLRDYGLETAQVEVTA